MRLRRDEYGMNMRLRGGKDEIDLMRVKRDEYGMKMRLGRDRDEIE